LMVATSQARQCSALNQIFLSFGGVDGPDRTRERLFDEATEI
jgi:hypothetical protein